VQVRFWDGASLPARAAFRSQVRTGGFYLISGLDLQPENVNTAPVSSVVFGKFSLARVQSVMQIGEKYAVGIQRLYYSEEHIDTGCSVWQLSIDKQIVELNAIDRPVHCIHKCGDGCQGLFGLQGTHDYAENDFFVLNEHFVR